MGNRNERITLNKYISTYVAGKLAVYAILITIFYHSMGELDLVWMLGHVPKAQKKTQQHTHTYNKSNCSSKRSLFL